MKKILMTAAAFAAVALPTGVSQSVSAQENEDKVTICHRTNSASNPYVQITVDKSAVDGTAGNSGSEPDHFGEHKGPLASSEAVANQLKDSKTEWGDIIPPVEGSHEGLNWTAEGQAMYRNNCNFVPPTVTTNGGNGGGEVTTQAAPQVKTPARSPNAGGGGAVGSVLGSLVALGGSLGALAYGVVRFRKFGA